MAHGQLATQIVEVVNAPENLPSEGGGAQPPTPAEVQIELLQRLVQVIYKKTRREACPGFFWEHKWWRALPVFVFWSANGGVQAILENHP